MPKYEVSVVYRGNCTYIVETVDEDTAKDKARSLYVNGDDGENTGAEFEEVESIKAEEVME